MWLAGVCRRPQTSAYPAAMAAEQPLAAYGRRVESDTLEYSRPAFTPPAVLDTPVPGRPAAMSYAAAAPPMAAGLGSAVMAYSAAPTPIPPNRPPPSPSGAHLYGQSGDCSYELECLGTLSHLYWSAEC